MEISSVRREMRVLVARPLSADIKGDVGKVGLVVGIHRGWVEVVLDGESTMVPFRATELDALRSSQSG